MADDKFSADLESDRNERIIGHAQAGRRTVRITTIDSFRGERRIVRVRLLTEDGKSQARIDLHPEALAQALPIMSEALAEADRGR